MIEPAPPAAPTPDDPERRLAEAAARSPEVAALVAGRRPRGRRRLAWAAGVSAALLVAGVAGLVTLRPRPRPDAVPELRAKWQGTLLQPVGAADAGDGERVARFSGFAVQVETEPSGAVVEVDGQVRGESPVFAGVDCAPGDRVIVRARLPGRAAVERATQCRADALVGLTLRLHR